MSFYFCYYIALLVTAFGARILDIEKITDFVRNIQNEIATSVLIVRRLRKGPRGKGNPVKFK